MKKIKTFLSGIILGAAATFYGIWHWEKSRRKRISTVADKYYDKAKLYAENLITEYGDEAKEKLSKILEDTQSYLKNTLKVSKGDLKKIMEKLQSEANSLYEDVKNRAVSVKKHLKGAAKKGNSK